jgi:hypothetical protein
VIGALHVVRDNLPTSEFAIALAGCSIIALMGLSIIIYPNATYEWFVVKLGNDDFRHWAPERGPWQLWTHRVSGAVMFLGGAVMLVLLVVGRSVSD